MRRILMITATAILATSVLVVPSAAAETDARPTDSAEVDQDRVPLKLRCRGMIGLGWAPKVRCNWNETNHPDAAGYKLVRVGEGERKVVHETRDLSATGFTDRDIEFNTRYRYRVIVIDEGGKRVQRSRWNRAAVRRPNVEVLRLKCAEATETDTSEMDVADEAKVAGCAWRPAQREKADHYELWRKIRGQHRELVAEVGLDQLSQLDKLPGDTEHVVYALLARDSEDHIVGRSRLSKVSFVNDAA